MYFLNLGVGISSSQNSMLELSLGSLATNCVKFCTSKPVKLGLSHAEEAVIRMITLTDHDKGNDSEMEHIFTRVVQRRGVGGSVLSWEA